MHSMGRYDFSDKFAIDRSLVNDAAMSMDANEHRAISDAAQPGARHPVREWIIRYLPYEIVSAAGELGGVALAYAITHSLVAGALAGTLGAAIGYYATAFLAAVRQAYRQLNERVGSMRVVVANALALRSVAVEFGLAEFVDSLGVRPVAYYLLPTMLGNAVAGWVAAKVISDAVFYLLAIFSYEKFGGLLVQPDIRAAPSYPGRDSISRSRHRKE